VTESGVLRSFLPSLYGAGKTGREGVKSGGGCFVPDPGETSHQGYLRREGEHGYCLFPWVRAGGMTIFGRHSSSVKKSPGRIIAAE
jgi:hypothetical protein